SFDNRWGGVIKTGDVLIELKARYFRPTEVDFLLADSSKAKRILNWEPQILFKDLVKIMLDFDLLSAGIKPKFEGYRIAKQKGLGWTEHKFVEQADIQNEV
ncbi:MAG: GDP-mannose 4,6-dehydratase, partial [Candidatus Kapaibacteriota bacterium]